MADAELESVHPYMSQGKKIKWHQVFLEMEPKDPRCAAEREMEREKKVNKAIVAALTPLLSGTIETQSQIRRTHAARQK